MPEEKAKYNKIAYNNEFNKENYDRIYVTVPAGQKDIIKAHAERKGEKLNTYK